MLRFVVLRVRLILTPKPLSLPHLDKPTYFLCLLKRKLQC